jgi:hypothetical protein
MTDTVVKLYVWIPNVQKSDDTSRTVLVQSLIIKLLTPP